MCYFLLLSSRDKCTLHWFYKLFSRFFCNFMGVIYADYILSFRTSPDTLDHHLSQAYNSPLHSSSLTFFSTNLPWPFSYCIFTLCKFKCREIIEIWKIHPLLSYLHFYYSLLWGFRLWHFCFFLCSFIYITSEDPPEPSVCSRPHWIIFCQLFG